MERKQNMTDMFKGYSDYSAKEYKEIWKNAIIVVDSNILLNFYRYSEDTRNKIFKILESLQDRLWIPYQVGKEFFDNKNKVMVSSYNEYNDLMTLVKKKIQEAKEETDKRKNNQLKCKSEINAILDSCIKQIGELLDKEKINKKPKFENNIVEHKMLELFNNSIGEQIIGEEFEEMKKEGLRRFKEGIPPGYKDRDKEENGDYYIFYSFIKEAKEKNRDVIFMTDDVKEDWFNEINGEKHGGRCELLNEFYKETNRLLLIYTSDGFMEAYNKNLDKDFVDEKTISELKSIRDIRTKEYYNNLIYKEFINKLKDYKNIGEFVSLDSKEEILDKLRMLIKEIDIPQSDREKLLYDLRAMRHHGYYPNELYNIRLKNIIDKIADYYNGNYFTIKMNDPFEEKYEDCLLALRKGKTKSELLKTYNLLIKIIEDHLKYLSDSSDEESYILASKLKRFLLKLVENVQENNFSNKDFVIMNLETIIKGERLLMFS